MLVWEGRVRRPPSVDLIISPLSCFRSDVHAGHRRGAVAVARLVAGDGDGRRSGDGRRTTGRGQPPWVVVDAAASRETRGHADRAGLLEVQVRRRRRERPQGVPGVGRTRAAPVHRKFPGMARPRRHRRDQHEGMYHQIVKITRL